MDEFEPKRVVEFPLRSFHARILQFDSIHSTNTFLKDYARRIGYDNLDPKAAICASADEQTAGRGRMDRSWHSPRGEGLYFSILIKPKLSPERAPMLTLTAATAAAEAIGKACSGSLDIKWPNDILVGGRKIAGILTEASFESARLNYAVIGFGVNVNQKHFPDEIEKRATSICLETEREISRDDFMIDLLERIDHWYGVLSVEPEKIIEQWKKLSSFAEGRSIKLELNGREQRAVTCGLESSGALRIRLEDGTESALYGGEIVSVDE